FQVKGQDFQAQAGIALRPLPVEQSRVVAVQITADADHALKYSSPPFTGGPFDLQVIVDPRRQKRSPAYSAKIQIEQEDCAFPLFANHHVGLDVAFLPVEQAIAQIVTDGSAPAIHL